MTAPLIGITTSHVDERGNIEMPANYAQAVRRAGGIPLLIQPGEPRMDELMPYLHALILSGGGDVDPSLYSNSTHAEVFWVNPQRDAFEIDLVHRTMEMGKPLLCICRGLQVLNVALGGTLIQDIVDGVPQAIDHRNPPFNPTEHVVHISAESRLAAIMQRTEVSTASWHHQAIETVAPALQVVGRASDGVIEAVELPGYPQVMAVQWHPEITAAEDASQQALFDTLVRIARKV